jgi:3-mercaptopyruvate sulfurtransferase SseA
MFEDQAVKMLRAMDMTGHIPGAINAEDLQTALDHLEKSIEKEAAAEKPIEFSDEVFDDERKAIESQVVSAKARAFPLIELLKISIKQQKSVMWEYE